MNLLSRTKPNTKVMLLFVLTVTFILYFSSSDQNAINPLLNKVISKIPRTTKKYVVLSTNIDATKDYYTFYLPVIIHAWRIFSYEPIVLLVSANNIGRINRNSTFSRVFEYLNKSNVAIIQIETVQAYEMVITQFVRLFIGVLPNQIVRDDDYLITSDTDLVPLRRDYYRGIAHDSISVWNAYCCSNFKHNDNNTYAMYPMGHIGMTKETWRKVMELNTSEYRLDGKSVLKKLFEIFGNTFKQSKYKSGVSWNADQIAISVFIHKYVNVTKIHLDLKKYTGQRLDRALSESSWNSLLKDKQSITDAHLFQDDVLKSKPKMKLFKNFLKTFFADYFVLKEFYDFYFET